MPSLRVRRTAGLSFKTKVIYGLICLVIYGSYCCQHCKRMLMQFPPFPHLLYRCMYYKRARNESGNSYSCPMPRLTLLKRWEVSPISPPCYSWLHVVYRARNGHYIPFHYLCTHCSSTTAPEATKPLHMHCSHVWILKRVWRHCGFRRLLVPCSIWARSSCRLIRSHIISTWRNSCKSIDATTLL